MHIILAILGAIAFIGVWWWRIKMAAEAGREIKRQAEGVANLPRKLRFKAKTGKKGLSLIDDPMEAGAAVMLGSVRTPGQPSAGERDVMIRLAHEHFRLSETDAAALVDHIIWMLREEGDLSPKLARLVRIIRMGAGQDAMADLVDMVDSVIRADGAPSSAQQAYLSGVLRAAGGSQLAG